MQTIEKKIKVLMMLTVICFMISVIPLVRADYSRGSSSSDSGSSSSSDKKDGGDKDKKSDNESGKDSDNSSGDSNKQEKEETKDDESDNDETDDSRIMNREELKGTPQEQEEAALEDAINDEPKPKHDVNDDPEWCDTSECTGPGSHDGIDRNCVGTFCYGNEEDKQRCKDMPNAEGCQDKPPNNQPRHEDGNPTYGEWCKQHPDKCNDGKGHDDDDHKHHHNWCDSHNCHHHTHTSTSHNNDGDVTVKVNLKYKEKNPKNLDDVELIIGDVYDKTLDLSKKPDTIKVDNLDIDGGDDFAVCLANEDSQEGECTVTEADSDHDTVTVWLDVK